MSGTVLTDQSKDLNDRFYLILNELVQTFSLAKSSPDAISPSDGSQTNGQIYATNLKLMQVLQNDYFLYKNNIVAASETLLQSMNEANNQINGMESQNKILHLQLDNLKNSTHSAEGLFDDAQITRNQLLVSNWILFAIIASGGILYYKSMKTAA
jgi:hypothetical protein